MAISNTHKGTRGLAVVSVIVASALGCVLVPAHDAHADGRLYPPVTDPVTVKECGACHMAYPAAFLDANTWKLVVAGLNDHFGENASLDPVVAQNILAYLSQNAAPAPTVTPIFGSPAAAPVLRITEQPWFKGEHGPRRMSPANLKRKNARSASDCLACHKGADVTGNFDD
jgi:hypothetical protein